MKIFGTVTDAAHEKPLEKAKLVLYVGETELVTFYSDKGGQFQVEKELDPFVGQTLICQVEKEGFRPGKVTHRIGGEDIRLDVELVLKEPIPEILEPIKVTISVTDQKERPLPGVKITLEVDATQVAAVSSDAGGGAIVELAPDLKDKTLRCKGELDGFNVAVRESDLKAGATLQLTMIPIKRPIPKRLILIAGIVAVLILGVVVYILIKPPDFQVTRVALKAVPERYGGACPKTIRFKGEIAANSRGAVKYKFVYSNGHESPVRIIHFKSAGAQKVGNIWRLYGSYRGWQLIRIVSPQALDSKRASFAVRCEPPF